MSDYAVIADVSQTLEKLLNDAMKVFATPPKAQVHDLQDPISLAPPTLTIFLFDVVEDPNVRNRPRLRGVAPPDVTITKPPMALQLHYLLTPWSKDRSTDQQMLGRAMQVLYDNATLSGPRLVGGLANTDQIFEVVLTPLSLEERARVWNAVHKPYRLSVVYEVRVINLDPESAARLHPVGTRSLNYEGAGSAP